MLYICICAKITFQLRYFIELSYKGTNYHGWQYQPNAITIQELLNKALSTIFRTTIDVLGAGRTDSGVHAEQLFAHFDLDYKFNLNEVIYKLNSILPNDIVVHTILKVKEDAHARFDALSRSYEYRIYKGRNPFLTETTWQLNNKKLNANFAFLQNFISFVPQNIFVLNDTIIKNITFKNKNLYLSARNLKGAKVVNALELNTYDISNANKVLLCEGSLNVIEQNLS